MRELHSLLLLMVSMQFLSCYSTNHNDESKSIPIFTKSNNVLEDRREKDGKIHYHFNGTDLGAEDHGFDMLLSKLEALNNMEHVTIQSNINPTDYRGSEWLHCSEKRQKKFDALVREKSLCVAYGIIEID